MLLPCDHWQIQGVFRAPPPPKAQSGPFAPPPEKHSRSVWILLQHLIFFYRYERCHKSLALPDGLFFQRFLKFKNSKLSSEFQNLPALGWLLIHNRFKTNWNKKRTFFFYIKNIIFGHIFDDFGDLPCRWQIGYFFIFSKMNFGSSQKIVA